MKNLLALLTLSSALGLAQADPRLHGTLTSVAAENGALPGVMVLNKDGTASLSPEGFPSAPGTWVVSADKKVLTLSLTDIGPSAMDYVFEARRLVLTYDNGNRQPFEKTATTKAPVKPTGPRAEKK
jgi:hypothetical protein